MSSANFAPYKPAPDEERLGGMVSGSSATAGSSAATSPKPSQASRAPLRGSASTSAQNNSKLDQALGRSSIEGGYRDDDDEDGSYDVRYATESYQSSMPRAQQSFSSNGGFGVGATSFSSEQPYHSSPSAKSAWSNGLSGPPSSHNQSQSYGFGNGQRGQVDSASYSTSQGFNLSNLCFAAWAFPPFSSVLLLIYETENDLVRFHAYQAGMFGVGSVLLLWILRSWFGWYAISIIVGMASLGYAWICGSNAANAAPTLTRSPYLPALGPLAEQWLGEE